MVICLFLNAFCVLIIGERLALKIGGRLDVDTPSTPLLTTSRQVKLDCVDL